MRYVNHWYDEVDWPKKESGNESKSLSSYTWNTMSGWPFATFSNIWLSISEDRGWSLDAPSSPPSSSDYLFLPLLLPSASSRSFASFSCSSSSSSKVIAQERLLMENHSPNYLAPPVSSSTTFLNARTEQGFLLCFFFLFLRICTGI